VSVPAGATQARERTLLAWSRTTVGALIVAGLLIRFAERGRAPAAGELAAALAIAFAAGIAWASRRRRGRERYEPRAMRGVAAGVTVVAVAALLAVTLALT